MTAQLKFAKLHLNKLPAFWTNDKIKVIHNAHSQITKAKHSLIQSVKHGGGGGMILARFSATGLGTLQSPS